MLSFGRTVKPVDLAEAELCPTKILPAFPYLAFKVKYTPFGTLTGATILTVAPATSVVNTFSLVRVIVPATTAEITHMALLPVLVAPETVIWSPGLKPAVKNQFPELVMVSPLPFTHLLLKEIVGAEFFTVNSSAVPPAVTFCWNTRILGKLYCLGINFL